MTRVRLLLGALLLTSLPLLVTTGADAAPADTDGPAYSQTKHLTRSFMIDGQEVVIDERDVTVTVDRTTELRGRERINISWTGAHPSGGRAANPFGEQGLLQEYPVVILQCRGLDDPSLPATEQLSPSTCWTSTRQQRTQSVDPSMAVWQHDLHATDADRAQKSGLTPAPAECNDVETFSTHITPFAAAGGTVFPACTSETMPPEAAIGAAFPPAEQAAFTDVNGAGSAKFEVRSDVENESLGCSDHVRCSVVVIPIEGISCLDDDNECRKAGRFEPGASNFANEGVDAAVSPTLWWAASNWRNRFSVPLSFGLPPDACDVLDSRPPTGFYGSELLAQASLQWSPDYCLDKKRFKFQHNKMPDDAAFSLMETGGGVAALVSGKHDLKGTDPVAYAPTAVTGFSIGYIIDKPQNTGEFKDLRLNPRLLAKLLTESYLGSEKGRGHPGMAGNPVSINLDPEFQQLNPGLDTIPREAGAPLLALSESSDVMSALTAYIAEDADALAFVNGKADPWGMVVNPSYKKLDLPTPEWPLLDDYVPPTFDECELQNPTPYFTKLAAPVTTLRKIAEAVLDAWPNVQTKCTRTTPTDPWKIGRMDRQGVGSRFMLGVVSAGDANRFGLNQASLMTQKGTYVGPTQSAMAKAVSVAEPSKSGDGPFELAMDKVIKAKTAYPGTMVVYTAARTAGMAKGDAAKVAQFIEVSTTEGQNQGFGNGQLPPGYLPIAKTGATAPLFKQAQVVAKAVADQSGATQEPPGDGADGTGAPASTGGGASGAPTPTTPGSVTDVGPVPTDAAPAPGPAPEAGKAGKPAKATETKTPKPEPVAMPETQSVTSTVAGRLIPMLLGIALLGALAASLMRLGLSRRRSG